MDGLVEAITELVIKELAAARSLAVAETTTTVVVPTGPKVLVVAGPESVADEVWSALVSAKIRPSALVWSGFRQDQLPAPAGRWPLEVRGGSWGKVVGDYSAVCLLGSDLSTLGSVASLGAGGLPPAGVAIAAVSSGLPVFCESAVYEKVRRHAARLSTGFVRAFEERFLTVSSFGVEFGSVLELGSFMTRLGGSSGGATVASKGGGRDVVTAEDVDAVKRAGGTKLLVGTGAIVTPLARQQAVELGIEVVFQ